MALLVDIEKKLGNFHLKVCFETGDETLALLGASGCGKSLTLRCIAGIETPDTGRIVLDGVTLFDSEKGINLSPQQRHTGFLFQNYALFPNMTVLENIRAGARREKDAAKREKVVADTMESFGLSEFAHHYPAQLSGGQQQRTALARILVSDPRILLLDEPFSALDSHLRFRLEQEVRQVIARFGKTVLLVSHDREEVYRLSDSIAVMHQGRVEVMGTKEQVFTAPRTRNAAILTGCKNISALHSLETGQMYAADWDLPLTVPIGHGTINAVGIRARDIRPGTGENAVHCQVLEEIENPFSHTILLRPAASSAAVPLAMELDKPRWDTLRSREITVHLPANALLLLQDG